MKADDIRSSFISYFKERGHRHLPSSSLVPANDPTLLFTNAGMVQFKEYFLGERKAEFLRAVTAQKCVRAGGKHNDLEQVGRTTRHHTFFEMLGNFSFGDYFKEEAISYAWEFITKELSLPKRSLYVSVYQEDKKSADFWKGVAGLSGNRISLFGEKDNFWAMGESGPCGPCSEIHIDRGEKIGCGKPSCAVGCECGRFLEVWNLVFMEFNRSEDGRLTPLPRPSIDTGMGLERIASVLQKKESNYDTDLFEPIFVSLSDIVKKRYGHDTASDLSMRVIADHLRAMTFLIADGVLPSNEGRGYVLRRIMRRAIRHGKLLSQEEPFLHRLSAVVIDIMRGAYPELSDKKAFLDKVIYHEEERFLATLEEGMALLSKQFEKVKKSKSPRLGGDVAFQLYDTYGFPPDLTEIIAREEEVEIDWEGFEKEMARQKERAREAWVGSGEKGVAARYTELASKAGHNRFVGYETIEHAGRLLAILAEGKECQQARSKEKIELVFDETPFYAEAGGQVGDRGIVESLSGEGVIAEIRDTHSPVKGLIVHSALLLKGFLRVGEKYRLLVNRELREATANNHTATHLLHHFLREILGKHVKQAGSLVAPDRLRFDYTHFSPLSPEEIAKVEEAINARIRQNDPVQVRFTTYHQALEEGVIAMFGEKYGDEVRVIDTGGYSRELCGGTHVHSTGKIRYFKMISDTSLAAGVRRMEALTGERAIEYLEMRDRELGKVEHVIGAKGDKAVKRVHELLDEQKRLLEELRNYKRRASLELSNQLVQKGEKLDGCVLVVEKVDLADPELLREMADFIRREIPSSVVVLGAAHKKNVMIVVAVTENVKNRVHAGQFANEVAKQVGGGGGGKETIAQAGGNQPEKLDAALEYAKKRARSLLEK
ncbi:MAG: alanine--tRNA ligase [Deltaproteobacteria bacterium]|nr:alanine--tRNA ligase [Deltaproteobacteria bacterium]